MAAKKPSPAAKRPAKSFQTEPAAAVVVEKRGRGRPSKYEGEKTDRLAFKYGKLGLIDVEVADMFEVAESTINDWKVAYPSFSLALNSGKTYADARVRESFYHRAIGYKHRAEKIFCDSKTGEVTRVDYTEHYPPDTTAGIFWLKNRCGWRDKQEITHGGSIAAATDEQLDKQLAAFAAFLGSEAGIAGAAGREGKAEGEEQAS